MFEIDLTLESDDECAALPERPHCVSGGGGGQVCLAAPPPAVPALAPPAAAGCSPEHRPLSERLASAAAPAAAGARAPASKRPRRCSVSLLEDSDEDWHPEPGRDDSTDDELPASEGGSGGLSDGFGGGTGGMAGRPRAWSTGGANTAGRHSLTPGRFLGSSGGGGGGGSNGGDEDDGDDDDTGMAAAAAAAAAATAVGAATAGAAAAVTEEAAAAATAAQAGPKRTYKRRTEEERAAADAEKRRKADERARLRAERAAAKLIEKANREHQRLSQRQANGGLYGREIVAVLPAAFAASALGCAFVALLQEKRWGMWRAAEAPPPLAADVERAVAAGGGPAGGFVAVTFQRRLLSPDDVRAVPESVELRGPFVEAAPVPCVLLLFTSPAAFVAALRAPNGGFDAVLAAAARRHPGASLQAAVVGLDAHARALQAADFRAGRGAGGFDARRDVDGAVLRLQLTVPGLQLRKLAGTDAAVQHLLSLTRALGEQPYKRAAGRDEALAAGGAGDAFAAADAGGAMEADLGPAAHRFARCLARGVPGIGGGQAWAIAREHRSLGALTAALVARAAAGGRPADLISELRDPRACGAQRRLGGALGARLAALLTSTDPDEPLFV